MDLDLGIVQQEAESRYPGLRVWCGWVGVDDADIDGDLWVKLKKPGLGSILIALDRIRWREQLGTLTEAEAIERMAAPEPDGAA